jgi:hypothetical protein
MELLLVMAAIMVGLLLFCLTGPKSRAGGT